MKYLSIDIESCNGRFQNASMCSFGYCLADEKFNIIKQEDLVMNPIPKKFFNGRAEKADIKLAYTEEFFRSSPRFSSYYDKISSLFEDVLVIGFAVDNDVKYLNNACDYFDKQRINYRFLDVQILHRAVNKLKTVTSLSNASENLKEDFIVHRSDEDARMTLLVLKNILKEENLDLNDLVEKYGIVYGENRVDDFSLCRCRLDELAKISKTRTKNKNILIHGFIERLPHIIKSQTNTVFTRKYVTMSRDIQNEDVDLTRRIIYKLNKMGGRYVGNLRSCDIFVVKDAEAFNAMTEEKDRKNDRGKLVEVWSYEDFLKSIGSLPELDFSNDSKILKRHYEKVAEREAKTHSGATVRGAKQKNIK